MMMVMMVLIMMKRTGMFLVLMEAMLVSAVDNVYRLSAVVLA